MLAPKLYRVMDDLINCESGGLETALNPSDTDFLPSFGILQFRPETLLSQGVKYGILSKDTELADVRNRIYEGGLQVNVALKMVEKGMNSRVFWASQFPGCSRRYGYWQ